MRIGSCGTRISQVHRSFVGSPSRCKGLRFLRMTAACIAGWHPPGLRGPSTHSVGRKVHRFFVGSPSLRGGLRFPRMTEGKGYPPEFVRGLPAGTVPD